ncbi:hypothetical protein BUY35_12065, partial [Staphylococcus cohnii]
IEIICVYSLLKVQIQSQLASYDSGFAPIFLFFITNKILTTCERLFSINTSFEAKLIKEW